MKTFLNKLGNKLILGGLGLLGIFLVSTFYNWFVELNTNIQLWIGFVILSLIVCKIIVKKN